MWYLSSFLKNSPFMEMEKMKREFDTLFNMGLTRPSIRSSAEYFPSISVVETNEDLRVYAFAPGFDSKDFDISIQGNLLTIAGKREKPVEVGSKSTCHRNERPWGEFTRMINLTQSVDNNQILAEYKNGILTLIMAKKAELKPKRIEIKAN